LKITENMNKLKKGLVGLTLGGFLAVSGCSGLGTGGGGAGGGGGYLLGNYSSADFKGTELEPLIKEQADKSAQSEEMKDIIEAFKGYGSIGMLKEAKEQWWRIYEKNQGLGSSYGQIYLKLEQHYGKDLNKKIESVK